MDKTLRKATDLKLQRAETYRYSQSLSPGERLAAVWEQSAEVYGYREPSSMNRSKDQRELLSALNEHGAKYLVIGGYAVGIYTEPRATKDLDVSVRCDAENSELVFRALAAFGAPLEGMGPEDFRDGESFFQMGQAPIALMSFSTVGYFGDVEEA